MNKYIARSFEKYPNNGYLRYHAPRYDTLLTLLNRYYSDGEKILDVGRSPFCEIASQALGTSIDTLGFEEDRETETGYNYQFDLNDAQSSDNWRDDLPTYNIIIFSEVIEHLYTSPKLVLRFLKSLLADKGIVIIQTPNAVALHKRLKMVFGKNPYHLISENTGNPAHYREYTADELETYITECGFNIIYQEFENYFDYRYRDHTSTSVSKSGIYFVLNSLYNVAPHSLRPGLCFVIRKK